MRLRGEAVAEFVTAFAIAHGPGELHACTSSYGRIPTSSNLKELLHFDVLEFRV